jgi:hypothetical protein
MFEWTDNGLKIVINQASWFWPLLTIVVGFSCGIMAGYGDS